MNKLRLLFNLMHKGSEVSDVEKWKKRQIQAAQIVALVGILVALAKTFGYEVPLSDADQASIGVALYALVNWMLTATTSKRAGFEPPVEPPVVQAPDETPLDEDLYKG